MGLSSMEQDYLGFGFRKQGQMWEIVCSGCGEQHRFTYKQNNPPQIHVKKFRNLNWRVDQSRPPLCAKCYHPKKEPDMVSQGPGYDTKLFLGVVRKLDEHFDTDKRLYKPGWTDEGIAKAANTSTSVVAQIRRDGYGELAEDPELTVMRAEIATAHDLMMDEMAKLNERLLKCRDENTKLGEDFDRFKTRQERTLRDLVTRTQRIQAAG